MREKTKINTDRKLPSRFGEVFKEGVYSIDKEAVYEELSEKHKMGRKPVQQWFTQRKRADKIAKNKARRNEPMVNNDDFDDDLDDNTDVNGVNMPVGGRNDMESDDDSNSVQGNRKKNC
ncbi:unnamed protein product [Caenorhabditis nigoni]